MSPIDPVGALSKIGRHVRAVIVGLPHAAGVDADEEDVGWVGIPTPATVRLARKGPIRR